jgi:hypothetical protein
VVTRSRGLRLLRNARELILAGWCQGADARDRDGNAVDPWNEHAVQWSILGAIVRLLEHEAEEYGEVPLDELASALYAIADSIEVDSLADWNDAAQRTQTEVIETMRAAETVFEPPWPDEARPDPN